MIWNRSLRRVFLILAVNWLCLLSLVGVFPEGPDIVDERTGRFGRELDALREKLHIPGMAAAVVRDREVIWSRGFGMADIGNGIEATADTPFRLASVTKTYASTVILRLVEEGKIDLDSPVSDFGVDIDGSSEITVRHLMSHTSEGKPGSRYKYNGYRFGQLGGVIEHATGRSFAEHLRELIIEPLGLRNTSSSVDGLAEDLARPYGWTRKEGVVTGKYPEHFSPAAGLMASVADVARYDIALDSDVFVKPETRELAWTPTVSTGGRDLPYGLGWFTQKYRGTRLFWHYGYWDSISTLYLKVPDYGLSFILLANTDALSDGFGLGGGNVRRSPAARLFLDTFVFSKKN